jgi:DNA-binding CsgD family transcriptional regulator
MADGEHAPGAQSPAAEEFDSGDALFSMNGWMQVVSWNEAAERLIGKPAAEVIGRPCWEAIAGLNPDGSAACQPDCAWIRSLRAGRLVSSQDLLLVTARGLRRVAITTVSANDRDTPLYLHVLRDEGPAELPPEPVGKGPLSRRQLRVLGLLAEGRRARDIAVVLGLSETTVRNHIRAVLSRLGCHSQLEAVAEARRRGLI